MQNTYRSKTIDSEMFWEKSQVTARFKVNMEFLIKHTLDITKVCSLFFNCFVVVQSLSHVQLFATPWTAAHQASPSFTNSQGLCTHVHWIGDAIQPSHPLSPPSPALNLSQHEGLFQWVSSSHQVAKYWSFSFSISPSNEYSGLISFRIDWFDLLAVQGTLKNLLQHHNFPKIPCSIQENWGY